ncbi:MAG: D-alanine--D-alanine ligase [Oscillospiraceae bacterium]|jgi:D-alanine-D-alanine ligase|nr:D-alanine--D-alanine ligase [Oscillospiraceae bacterium]
MKIVLVIFGGKSTEYEVSLASAISVINNIPKDIYQVLTLGITKDGSWFLFEGKTEEIESDTWHTSISATPAVISPDAKEKALLVFRESGVERVAVDVVFPVLHGKNGEDGVIQGLFELACLPYVGCDLISSAVCMDKVFTNTLADALRVRQAKWLAIKKFDYAQSAGEFETQVTSYLGFPCFVKPANAGSSVGISKVKTPDALAQAMADAFVHDHKVLVEEGINGYEVECAVLGNDDPLPSVVGQVIPSNEFYDYSAKYIDNASELIIPARISPESMEAVRACSVKIFKALGCSGLSRVDFFVEKTTGEVYFNEINTLPGFTSISMYPKLFAELGISYPELLDRLIRLALEKQ